MVVATALAALTLLCLALSRVGPTRRTPPHPESLTAVLGPGDEEYLAWLAAEHWPEDEYLDLERSWRARDGEDAAD
ncbi:hypothetical protein BTM25_45530 [Actinomadura rubteroloni]|uniref:Uncharacterized protein n=1 Tax=Actinomadura rubteroloni TaxID=1926885 RepID=A0A2P4UEB7_9ACTN|nr:hypothetical protein [Actinomadura rubteroloni]POM23400.1 hypothetical protein BTM25_45530 [Actinomadura rubteroloni]